MLHGLEIKHDGDRFYAHLWTRDDGGYETVFAVSDNEEIISTWIEEVV